MPTPDLLAPDEEAMQAELEYKLERLAKQPTYWMNLEPIGRILRWRGDPDAVSYFRRAIAHYRLRDADPDDHLHLANLHRLAGDLAAARPHVERAHELYAQRFDPQKPDPNPDSLYAMFVEHLIPASFLLGKDEEVAKLMALFLGVERSPRFRRGLVIFPIARLAAARQACDPDLAGEAVNELARLIRRSKAHLWDSGPMLPWDWYEIGLDTWHAL